MTARQAVRTARDELPGPASQAFAVVGGLAAWGVALVVAYPTVQIACAVGQPLLVHLVRWTATVVALAATFTGYRVYRRAQAADASRVSAERIERVRFLGFGGMLLSAGGTFLLLIEDLATWVIDPCL